MALIDRAQIVPALCVTVLSGEQPLNIPNGGDARLSDAEAITDCEDSQGGSARPTLRSDS